MNFRPSKSRRLHDGSPSPIFLPKFIPRELTFEVLSFLPVKSMMRMRCLSKSYNSLFTDPVFVKMHLQRSARNPYLALITTNTESVIPFPVRHLLNNPSISLDDYPHYLTVDDIEGSKVCSSIVGSCNGLICLLTYTYSFGYRKAWLRFWNPSTRTISKKLGYLPLFSNKFNKLIKFQFTFGYDNLTSTYKVVLLSFHYEKRIITETKVFSLGDNIWRNIPNLPVVPLQLLSDEVHYDVYLSGTITWLAVFDFPTNSVYRYVIISIDLGSETYTQMRLPQGFDELSRVFPTIGVLKGCLSFSYDLKQTHFVLWHMTEFGVEESWTQLLQISYENLQIEYNFGIPKFYLVPFHLSEDGETLIFASNLEDRAILYNRRNNSVARTRITNTVCWFSVFDYVESLVSTC